MTTERELIRRLPTSEELHQVLSLDPETGDLFWRVTRTNSSPAGSKAGGWASGGYRKLQIYGQSIYCHRVVFCMTHHRWPEAQIDHINGVVDDNRPANLREATSKQNGANRHNSGMNTSGIRGVSWYKKRNIWQAGIKVNGKSMHLGYFNDPEIAGQAYAAAAREHFGEFASQRVRLVVEE